MKSELPKGTKGLFPIHSPSIQAVCHKYIFAREAAHAARKSGFNHKYPYKQKKNFNTKWANNSFKVFLDRKIQLSMGILEEKCQKSLSVWVKHLPIGKIKKIELIYDRELMLSIVFDDGIKAKTNMFEHRAAINVGEVHTIAAVAENGENLIITGRKLRSIHRLRNKKLSELQKKMAHCKKGSKQWSKYNRAKQYILSKSARQLQDRAKSSRGLVLAQ